MDRDLHDDCLRILRTKPDLTEAERGALSYVAGRLASGEDVPMPERREVRSIIWSFHGQGPGRPRSPAAS